jgi:iron(II)-dependent oxidoreductase
MNAPRPQAETALRATAAPWTRAAVDRDALVRWYRRNRARSATLFDMVDDNAYTARPISLRHPLVFYEGHLPGFSFNTLVKRALGGASIDAGLEELFARGIDPDESRTEGADDRQAWPSREVVKAFAA